MARNDEAPTARDVLTACLDAGQTGCLVGRFGTAAAVRVYVMLGEVLAAHADDDDEALVARLRRAGRLGRDEEIALRAALAEGRGPSEALFDLLEEDVLQHVLYERFRENLYQFLGAPDVEPFETMEAVFTDNIQVGHDSRTLLDELLTVRDQIGELAVRPQMVVAPGAAPASSEQEQEVLDSCGDRLRLGDLLDRSPWEPSRTLRLVRAMLDSGALVGLVPQPRRTSTDTSSSEPPVVDPASAEPAAVSVAEPAASVVVPAAAEPVTGPDPDDVTADPSAEDDDDDLAAFQDYDTSRHGGLFSSELLDKVDLDVDDDVGLPASTETILEMEDAESAGKDVIRSAVSLNFSGPRLSDDDVQRKLEVISDVLATIARAMDESGGAGAGQARLQLIIEGSSVALAPLFKSVELERDGRLPIPQIVKNLRRRPVSEHRSLLNRALSDLTDRALSAADEALDEEGLEAMLEQIAGYQQRLGI